MFASIDFERVAWMGGTHPKPLKDIDPRERTMVSFYFREQMKVWTDYWQDNCPKDTRKVFWNRARHDAHASRRSEIHTIKENRYEV